MDLDRRNTESDTDQVVVRAIPPGPWNPCLPLTRVGPGRGVLPSVHIGVLAAAVPESRARPAGAKAAAISTYYYIVILITTYYYMGYYYIVIAYYYIGH